jgi:hypothetical protein
MALGLTILAIPLWFFAPVIGAIVIFLAVRHWKSPMSLVRGSKTRFVIAAVLGATEMVGSVLFYYYLFTSK